MEKYYIISLTGKNLSYEVIEAQAHESFNCKGIEFFSIDEQRVDEILGERSYSGGDVPESVIFEVEQVMEEDASGRKLYFETRGDAENFQNFLKDKHAIESEVEEFEQDDWNQKWRENFQAIEISDKFHIIPSWEKEECQNDSNLNVFIYPGMGFGTGNHETTYLCLKLYVEMKKKNLIKTCLDFGCGSGILGIAVNKEIDCPIDLYDIDQDAIVNCEQNIELNDLNQANINIYLPKDRNKLLKEYDLVFANILQSVLMLESNYLATCLKPGGRLILSGLLVGQEKSIIEHYMKLNKKLVLSSVIKKGDWIALSLEHKL